MKQPSLNERLSIEYPSNWESGFTNGKLYIYPVSARGLTNSRLQVFKSPIPTPWSLQFRSIFEEVAILQLGVPFLLLRCIPQLIYFAGNVDHEPSWWWAEILTDDGILGWVEVPGIANTSMHPKLFSPAMLELAAVAL